MSGFESLDLVSVRLQVEVDLKIVLTLVVVGDIEACEISVIFWTAEVSGLAPAKTGHGVTLKL